MPTYCNAMTKKLTLLLTALGLTACSTGSLLDNLPDRSPDYRQSHVGRKIEVPPDLTSDTLNDQLVVSDFTPSSSASYNDYYADRIKRDSRGYIQVLPELYGVQVHENAGQLPYISTAADPSTSWTIVKNYWLNNGVRLAVDNPAIGIMETDWLENQAGKPKAGVSGLLNGLLGFLNDSDQRDRYRMRFTRNVQGGTDITLIYTKSEQVAQYDFQSGKDPAGYKWQISDNQNPELQLEMTRRIALYLSGALQKQTAPQQAQTAANNTNAQFARLNDGQLALVINQPYQQTWQQLKQSAQHAGYRIDKSDYNTGTYHIRVNKQAYRLRLANNGNNQSIVIVQNASGKAIEPSKAQNILAALAH